jgi:5-formyltetrahydrofolate cyclo-ligase
VDQQIIAYTPLSSEVNPFTFFPDSKKQLVYVIPSDTSSSPTQEAARCKSAVSASSVSIFIPGRRFDAGGTRYGRGLGWYDRFLRSVPSSWIRVGFCYEEQFSAEALTRQSWDEPMDLVCVVNKKTQTLLRFVTLARAGIPIGN